MRSRLTPLAMSLSAVPTGIRRPRMQDVPPMTAGAKMILSISMARLTIGFARTFQRTG